MRMNVFQYANQKVGKNRLSIRTGLMHQSSIHATINNCVVHGKFIINCWNFYNFLLCRGFIMKSPIISLVGQYWIDKFSFSFWTLTKNSLIFRCLDCLPANCLPFSSKSIALRLSWNNTFLSPDILAAPGITSSKSSNLPPHWPPQPQLSLSFSYSYLARN
jgi:hypothetical protein